MDHEAFRQGYIAGWRSVKGADANPDVPEGPALDGASMYLVGFARAVRDAKAVALRPMARSPSAPPL